MSDAAIAKQLNSLNLKELVDEQRHRGRMHLPASFRQYWTSQYHLATDLLADDRRGVLVRKLAGLLRELTFSIATVPAGDHPNYYQYTDAHLLDWFLAPELATLGDLKTRCLKGMYLLLRDLLDFEARSLAGFETTLRESFDRETVHRREDVLRSAVHLLVEVRQSSHEDDTPHFGTIEQYALQPSRESAMLHFSCMPLTQNHDEVVFLRTLHGSELCFFGIRLCLTAAIELIKTEEILDAAKELAQAVSFSRLLHKILQVLRTMPVTHFAQFRDFTGKASALQSANYHLMEIFFRGVNTDKANHFAQVDRLRPLLRFAHNGFVSLQKAISAHGSENGDWEAVLDAARQLDRQLLTWRGLHLSFAKLYIPAGGPGTGGTSGAEYLQRHLKGGLFVDTEPDWNAIQSMFPELELPGADRVRPGLSVARS